MDDTIVISRLSRAEKLQVMEALWNDLSRDDLQTESPAWHQDALAETERRLQSGAEQLLDWEEAKRELRKRAR